MHPTLISAICTPIDDNHSLDVAGLEAHIKDQWDHGIGGLLIAGSMGAMQLLSDQTYCDLIEQSVRVCRGQGELMVGVGDTSFIRTRERIEIASSYPIDAVVVISPYLIKFSQAELIDYFTVLADQSSKPVYLYDLPVMTGVKLELDTIEKLSKHPNILGIKCSFAWEETRQIINRLGSKFRIIPAQPNLIDVLIRLGVKDNLDGIFSIAPAWSTQIMRFAKTSDWEKASHLQQQLSDLLQLLRTRYAVFPGCEVVLNARGICKRICPSPMHRMSEALREQLLAEPLVRKLLDSN